MQREDLRERGNAPRRRPRRRKKLNPKAVPILAALLLFFLIGGFFAGKLLYEKYSPSKEMADLKEYFGLSGDQDMAVVINNEMVGDMARLIDGKVYLHVETVYEYIDSRFYWDEKENQYLYALPKELVSAAVGESSYTVAKSSQDAGYVVLRTDGSDAYVAADFLLNYTNFIYEYSEEPNRVRITTEFGNKDVVTAQKKAAVRWKAGIKSPILTNVDKGTVMYVLEEPEDVGDWTKVLTKDGFIGYVKNNRISPVTQETVTAPDFEEPEYTSISKDYTINMTWHQVTNMEANNYLLNKIADTKGLTTISPTWFSIADTDGNISSLASQAYVTYAHQQGWKYGDWWTILRKGLVPMRRFPRHPAVSGW